MKLRFRQNSLRLRVNRQEVDQLSSGKTLREEIHFPDSRLVYELVPNQKEGPRASYADGLVRVTAPQNEFDAWAGSDNVGIYFELQVTQGALKVAIEKDLECVDGPEEERDPHAFPRQQASC